MKTLYITLLLSTDSIIYIVVGILAILFLILLFILLEIYLFSIKRLKKKFTIFNNKYIYLHDLLTSQDKQYIERIELISSRNLIYRDVHKKYLDIYINLKNKYDEPLTKIVNELKISINEKDRKGFKSIYQYNLPKLSNYENELVKFNDELILVVKPEDDYRQSSLLLKNKYRELKTQYKEHEEELSELSSVFEKLFSNIDKNFKEFDNILDTAQFEDAKEYLDPLNEVLSALEVRLNKLPSYLKDVNEIIPQKLSEVYNHYQKLLESNLPLKQLDIDNYLNYIKKELIRIREGFDSLKINDVENKLDSFKKILDELIVQMNEEDSSRTSFNEKYEVIFLNYNNLEKAILKLNTNISKYEKYYLISEEEKNELRLINEEMDTLSKVKRTFDFFLHGIEKTYYSELFKKLLSLEEGIKNLSLRVEKYNNYLNSLKSNVDTSFKYNHEAYLKIKNLESVLRDFNVDSISNDFKEDIDLIYSLMDEINVLIKTIPIDASQIIYKNTLLNKKLDEISLKIEDLSHYNKLAENNILFINRERMKFSDIHNHLLQAENLYINGEYKSAYELTEEIYKTLKNKEKVIK